MGNVRFFDEVDFEKEENIRNIDFEVESVNDIGQVLVTIIVQETTLIMFKLMFLTLFHNKTMMRRSIKERRHAIPDDYIFFLKEHEDDIGLTKDDPINFCRAMQKSNYKKWIDAMKDEMKSMQDNDVWDLFELPEGVKPIGCKWIFKTKKDSKGNIERYKARLEDIDYKEIFCSVSSKNSFRTIMTLVAHFDLEIEP
ncbi:hypothetical protein CR513_21434, partial [Mucuna pruriens]